MTNEEIIWKANSGPQTEVLKRTEYEILYGGSRGGGKTDAGLAWLLRWIGNPKYRALIIRINEKDLRDWVERAKMMYRGTGADFAYRPTEIRFPSGAHFITGHLNNSNAYIQYQGHEYQKMVIEELTQIQFEEDYLKLISSCRSTVDGLQAQVFCTTNPGGLGHEWVKNRFIDVGKWGEEYVDPVTNRGRIFVPAKLTDNPVLMEKDPTYLNFLDGLPDQLRRAWRDGDWDITAGQVFTEFRRETHVVEPFDIPKEWNRYIAIDWGVNAPFTVGWYAEDYDSRTYLYRELYMNGMEFERIMGKSLTPKRLARVILGINRKHKESYKYATADPSCWNKPEGGESIAETMQKLGLKLIKGDNDRVNGLARIRELMSIAPDGKPYYQIFSSCTKTIGMYPALTYDLHNLEDLQTKGNDHGYDRDRYHFMSRPTPANPNPKIKENPIREMKLRKLSGMEYNMDDEEY